MASSSLTQADRLATMHVAAPSGVAAQSPAASLSRSTTSADLRFLVSESLEDPAWDAFLERAPGGNYVQSSLWGRSKAGFGSTPVRVIATTRDGTILGGAQMLLRKLPVVGCVACVYKGPVLADASVVDPLIDRMHQVARRLRVQYLAVQPPEGGEGTVDRLLAKHYRPGLYEWGQTPATTVVDLTQDVEQIARRMHRSTRANLRRAERMGVRVREGTERDIETFYHVLMSTGQRKGIPTNSLEYYQAFWQQFTAGDHLRLFIAEYDGEPLSALLAICFGDTVSNWKGGWTGSHGDVQPNVAIQWQAIQWAKAHGYTRYDFLGIDSSNTIAWALATGQISLNEVAAKSSFKLGFGGAIIVSPITYEYVPNPIVRSAYTFSRDHDLIWQLINSTAHRAQLRAHGAAHRAAEQSS